FFGTNDIRVDSTKYVPLKQYRKNLEEIAKACRKAQAKVIFCTPPPIDEGAYFKRHEKEDYDKEGGLTKLLGDNQEAVQKIGKAMKIPVVDLGEELEKKPKWMHKDGVHPSPDGNAMIADLVIEAIKGLGPLQ
ncbi:GDSL-type esterase/lipase family protein, partial [Akkermansiaceae bacterium]|nr:GDSL-type esterase/lipase family protein [Akkermansiaceae bacterium]